MADGHGRRRARQLLGFAVIAAALLVAFYVLLVLTPVGQSWDDQALVGRLEHKQTARTIHRLLDSIDRSTLVVMVIVLIVIALARHRRWLALASASGFAAAVVSAELLKRGLPRPDLAPEWTALIADKSIDTYPSGHSTISTAFVLALVMVSRNTYRPVVALIGVLWCGLIATSTVAAGWHRPSDALGGIVLAAAWMALAAGLLARNHGQLATTGFLDREVPWLILGALGVGIGAITVSVATGSSANVPDGVAAWAFPLGLLLIIVAGLAAVGAFTWLLRDLQFGQPPDDAETRGSEGKGSPRAGSRPAP